MLILGYLELETSYWPPASNDNGCSSTAWNLKKRKAFSAFLRFELKWIIYCYIANMRGSLSSDIQSQRSGFEAQWAAKVFEMNIRNDWMSAVLTLKCSTLILTWYKPSTHLMVYPYPNKTSKYIFAMSLRTGQDSTTLQGSVVWGPISPNPGINFNSSFLWFCLKAFSLIIFGFLFRASNHQIIENEFKPPL